MIDYSISNDSELFFATVGGIGVNHQKISDLIVSRLEKFNYHSETIRLSGDIISQLAGKLIDDSGPFEKCNQLMNLGNEVRKKYNDSSVLALAASSKIKEIRGKIDKNNLIQRNAFIITSLKRPEEINQLRNIYSKGFYVFGVYSSPERRCQSLQERGRGMTEGQAQRLMERDENESDEYGQKTRGAFQLADFFLNDDGDEEKLKNEIDRIIDLIFGYPYITPTFHEYAMFQAFSASLRSADLSRQVGAVIAKNDEILSSGANDCPKPHGGLYWPYYSETQKRIIDAENGRDFMRGVDTNAFTLNTIINQITNGLHFKTAEKVKDSIKKSDLPSLTEFGRMVHAEMEAILNCARNSFSCRGGTLYATTFPCHNCAKHIIAAGIEKVIYVEPYPKSKALNFYPDAITTDPNQRDKVIFMPFMGVGPRQFFDLFSMNLSSGRKMVRKDPQTSEKVGFDYSTAEPRVAKRPVSYLDFEHDINFPELKEPSSLRSNEQKTSRKRIPKANLKKGK